MIAYRRRVRQIDVCCTDNAFPSGEGGCPNGQTEEVCVQYNFAENTAKRYFYYTSPAPVRGHPIYYARLPPTIVYPMGFALVQRGGLETVR